ncbi:Hypothetical protein R9X50_00064300 [Acrodontium crateriforme]|uniref:RING-type E3 ubiquitin transferase n=1 Tax=Acrodontium crateriforme TaxID=150365 RepID=A0AAQ3LYH3_9PEZI|nr:Hypothetical protein R9X50_00064300 [Acrodontium crateriforme]
MSANQPQPQQRDVMFCHECENEWYRDEHGLSCPECHSDFAEVIEANNDPREDSTELEDPDPMYAPDPDEDDIDDLQWTPNPPGQPPGMRVHGTFGRTIQINRDQLRQHEESGRQGGLLGLLGDLVQNAIGGLRQDVEHQAAERIQQQREQHQIVPGDDTLWLDEINTLEARSTSEVESPPPQVQPTGPTVRHITGPGYSMTIASSSTVTGNFGDLFPRNAQQPQPVQLQPTGIDQILHQMIMNIGAAPRSGRPMRDNFHDPFGFDDLFEMFGAAATGGVLGDAVYSQEALDRIVTQLMEQHQSGNAPGPASADAIASLPKRAISKEDLDENGKADCSICMDAAEIGSEVTVLPCHHWFHFDCIKAWLSEHDTCPHCRQGIMPKDNENANQPRHSSSSRIPGAYPSSAGDSVSNPLTVPDSPTMNRPSNSTQGSSVFSRMRDAFGGSNSGNGDTDGSEQPRTREG